MSQQTIDAKNAEFWNELCGSWLARTLGIIDITPETLRRFDEAYLTFYPYLQGYVNKQDLEGKKVLEIGLGYGTLGQLLAEQNSDYYGLDIAQGPVDMMRYRLNQLDQPSNHKVQLGSALDIPHSNESFDYVYSIGCLHHTGNVNKAISEVYRVLIPGGKAIIMLYNQYSFRQLITVPLIGLRSLFMADSRTWAERVHALYDMNAGGETAPHTEYISRAQVKHLFKSFSHVGIDVQNFDTYILFRGRVIIPREKLINNVARLLGLDLYITATK